MRQHFAKVHPTLNLEEQERIFEAEKDVVTPEPKGAYTCNFYGKGLDFPCPRTFNNLEDKIEHMRSFHGIGKKIHCIDPHCSRIFDRPFIMRAHVEKCHN